MNSCYHCTRRKPGCHSVCEDYKRDCEDYKRDCEEHEQRRAYERRFASVDSMPQTQTVYKMIYEQKKRGGKQ